MLAFAENLGDISTVRFEAKDGPYHCKGAEIEGITASGEKFELSLSYCKEAPDAD
jgi:hypothetical protein